MKLVYIYKGGNDSIWLWRDGLPDYMLFPFIKFSTFLKYKSSPEFKKIFDKAVTTYVHRINNELKQLIQLSGKTKPVTVKGRGTYNIPIEVFDKIVKSSQAAGISPKQGLAIAIKESSGATDPIRSNRYYSGSNYEDSPNSIGPSLITSNWDYFQNSPYIELLKGWENSGWDIDRVTEDAKYQYKKHKSNYDKYDANIDEDILTNMFKIPLNKINSGEKGYVETINLYANNMSYKYGGRITSNVIENFRKRYNK